jgi:hypothetical protein
VRIALQRRPEERAHEVEDLLRIPVEVAGVDRLVVFIDEDHDPLAVVRAQAGREIEQGALVEHGRGAAVEDGAELPALQLAEPVAPEQVVVLVEQPLDLLVDGRQRPLEPVELRLLQREPDDRIPLEMGARPPPLPARSTDPGTGGRGPPPSSRTSTAASRD